jgi:hypothetical protein
MLLASIIFLPKINLSNQAKILYLKDVRYIWLSNFMALKVPYEGYSRKCVLHARLDTVTVSNLACRTVHF